MYILNFAHPVKNATIIERLKNNRTDQNTKSSFLRKYMLSKKTVQLGPKEIVPGSLQILYL